MRDFIIGLIVRLASRVWACIVVLSLAISPLISQTVPNRLWLSDTIFPSDGFVIRERLQNPVFGITVGVIPGAMPVPIQIQTDGTVKSWARAGYYWKLDDIDIIPPDMEVIMYPDDPPEPPDLPPPSGQWAQEALEVFKPVYSTIHFGYSAISPVYGTIAEKTIIVLEDGVIVENLTPLTTLTNQTFSLFTPFGLSQVSASGIRLSSDARYATWNTTLSGLGSAWASIITGQAAQAGFTESNSYKVVVDRYKARVFQYLKELGLYVPVAWRDRHGNTVTFKWERKLPGKPGSSQPDSVLDSIDIICLTIKNEQGKGAKIEWVNHPGSETEIDLIRIDFIDINAPSAHIKGYPGISSQLPASMTRILAPGQTQLKAIKPKTGGPINRPTIIQTGDPSQLPDWNYYWTPPQQTQGDKSQTRQWTFTYSGAYKNQIATYKDSGNLTTTFSYAQRITDYPFGPTYNEPYLRYGDNYPIRFMGVSSVSTRDQTLKTATQTWNWDSAAQTVTQTVSFESADLTTATYYGGLTPEESAGAVWRKRETLESGQIIAAVENMTTGRGGLDGALTIIPTQKITRKGEPAYTITTNTTPGSYGLRRDSAAIHYDSPSQTSNARLVQKTEETYTAINWAELNPGDLISVTTTTYKNGIALTPARIQKNEWSGIYPAKSYMANSANTKQLGANYTYDASKGQMTGIQPYYKENSATEYAAQQTYQYSATSNLLNKVIVTDNVSAYTSQITAYDTNDLPTQTTDQLGIAALYQYDDRGRLTKQTRAGITTTYAYPDELTITTTAKPNSIQGETVTTTRAYDAFGRIKSIKTIAITPNAPQDITETTYAYQSRTTTVTTTSNGIQAAKTITETDPLGRPVEISQISGATQAATTYYNYKTENAPQGTQIVTTTQISGSNTLTTEETRNLLGQTLQITGPKTTTVHEYKYDGLGNVTEHKTTTAQGAQTRTFTYDDLGRLLSKTEPETGTTTYSGYTVHGQPKVAEEPLEEQTYTTGSKTRVRKTTYDGFGRIEKITNETRAAVLVPDLTNPNFQDNYIWTVVTLTGADKLEYKYQTTRPLLQQSKRTQGETAQPETIIQDYAYDAAYSRLIEEKTTGADGFIARIGYAYDSKWGYINKVTYPGATSGNFGRSIHYDNDIYGRAMNVRNNTSTGAVLAHLAYDNQGRRSVLTFGSGAVNEYKYGTNGKRIDQLSEWRVTPNGQAPITRLFDYNANDYLTSTGEWSIQNDSLGRIQQTTGHGVRTFRGHDDFGNNIYHQATGLIYIRGRYYSPKWHRFINSDQGVDPNSINQFAYVNGRPFMATDPSGMEVVCDLLTTYTFLVLSDGRWYLLNVAEQIINCKNIDGGGGGETEEEKPPQLRTVTEEDCKLIRKILDKAKTDGDHAAAKYALDKLGIVGDRYTNNTSNNYGNLLPTSHGGIDLDWYITLLAEGGPNPPMFGSTAMGHVTYVFGKLLWESINILFTSSREGDGPYFFEGPYADPGERVAANAYATGVTFGGLFDQKWFDTYCGGK